MKIIMNKIKKISVIIGLAGLMGQSLTACRSHAGGGDGVLERFNPVKNVEKLFKNEKKQNPDGEIDMSLEEMYKLLEEAGYGKDIDWSKQTDDDPSIPKSMDVTADKDKIRDTYYKRFTDEFEPGDSYEKAWWDYLPDSYDISGDSFAPTPNYAGEEKQYNNSLQQSIIDDGLTSGQINDLDNVERIAKSFIYEEMKNKYRWTADLDRLCEIADSFGVADFYSKESNRPMWHNANNEWMSPGFMTAYYETSIVDYDLIGIPQFGGYKFNITVWEDKDELVGWIDEVGGTGFINNDEVYENMGEWDFYDELNAIDNPKKVAKPSLPNGAMMLKGKKGNLSKEQYVYQKVGADSGMIYYYGNGITVDMTFFGGKQGGNYKDALNYCKKICGN